MTDTQQSPSPFWQVCLVWIILLFGFGFSYYIIGSKPDSEKKERPNLVPTVQVSPLSLSEKLVHINTRGVVEESQVTQLAFQVGGKIESISELFEPGSFVKAGDVLAQLSKIDFEVALSNAQAKFAQARLNILQVEQNKIAAEEEWALYNKEGQDKPSSLLLKEPQLILAQKNFLAAKAEVDLANMNLERSVLRAPYDGVVAKRNVFVGSVVLGSTNAGEVVNSQECWVRCYIPIESLAFIQKYGKAEGRAVTITSKSVNQTVLQKRGEVFKILPRLEGQTRLAQLMVRVKDPFGLNVDNNVFLFSGLSVEASIAAANLKDVVVIKREYLREGDTIWLYDSTGTLKIQPVTVLFKNQTEVVLANGDWVNSQLVISDLPILKHGMRLKLFGDEKEKNGK